MKPCLFILLLFSNAFADDIPPLSTDTRVRISAPTILSRPIIGQIAYIKPDTLALAPRTRIPLNAISKLEISLGVQPLGKRVRSGAWKGALLAVGFVAAAAVEEYDDWADPNDNIILFAILGGGAVGGTLGGIYGALRRPERWATVPPENLKQYVPPIYRKP